MASGNTTDDEPELIEPIKGQARGNLDSTGPFTGGVSVTVNTDSVNIHASNLSALESIAEKNPELAIALVGSTNSVIKYEFRRYVSGAIAAAVVAVAILGFSAAVIIQAGFWAGIAFFMACAAASAIISAIFTGKSQRLNWVVGLMPGFRGRGDTNKDGD